MSDSQEVTVTRTRPAEDGWLLHELSDSHWCVWEKPRGRGRFHLTERGAGSRGTGRTRAAVGTLSEALELAASLPLSTTAEILADIPVYGDLDRKRLAALLEMGTPGARLWVLPGSNPGTGCAAASLGLAVNGVEAMFGGELSSWLIGWRTDDGEEGKGLYCVPLADAERAWWILDGSGNVVAGGPPIYDEVRALEIAAKYNGTAQLGPYVQADQIPA